jgi:hypothetical protein
MPEEHRGKDIGREPDGQSASQPPLQPPSNQRPPAAPGDYDPRKKEAEAISQLEKNIKTGEWWLIGIGVATLLVNIGIAKIYYGQLKEMREATRLTGAAVKIAGDTLTTTQQSNAQQRLDNSASALNAKTIADRNAAQANKSLQETIDNFHTDQRAWLGICDFGVQQLEVGKPFRMEIKFCNSGKTPALRVEERVGFRTSTVPMDGPIESEINELPFHPNNAVPPQGTYKTVLGTNFQNVTMPAEDNSQLFIKSIPNILSGELLLYVYGDVRYRDAFGKTIHDTQFCLFLADREKQQMGYCKTYNELD